MINPQPKVFVGIITFGALTAPYLTWFKKSLEAQSFRNFELIIHDNTDHNLGFSKAYNQLIEQARSQRADYFFVVNPDVYLKSDALEKLVEALENKQDLGSVAPKLLRWNFKANEFTDIIDSCGLGFKSGLYFFDIGQGKTDYGQYDNEKIIGPSGAAALYRMSALQKVAAEGQYFDEAFFMYKEDCDLAYRLNLAGFASALVPQAIAYHDRTAAGGSLAARFFGRRRRSSSINHWSFIHQYFLFIKHWRVQNPIAKIDILIRAGFLFVYVLILEPSLLPDYKKIYGFFNHHRFLQRQK